MKTILIMLFGDPVYSPFIWLCFLTIWFFIRKLIQLENAFDVESPQELKKRLRNIVLIVIVLAHMVSMSTTYMYTGKFFGSSFFSYEDTIWGKK